MDENRYLTFRNRFPIFRSKVYLNSCSQGALSDAVTNSLAEYLESWNSQGSPWDRWVELQETLRSEFADFIGATAEEVAITFSASTAIYSVASALDYRSRPKVVLGELEFPTQSHIWLAQQSRGARVEWVPAWNGTNSPEDYRPHLDDRTVILPVTHVCFRNGFRNDASGLRAVAHRVGAYLLLDDYQNCGTRTLDVGQLGVDFYVTGALKYLLAASGIAFLYVRRELIQQMQPTLTGWLAQRNPFAFDSKHHELADSAVRFQTGSPPVPALYAALAGIRLLKELGMEDVERRIAQLTQLFIQGVLQRGWSLKTPVNSQGPLVVVQAKDAGAVVRELGLQKIIVSSRDDGVRVSFHAYNTPADVEAILTTMDRLPALLEAQPAKR